MFATLAKPVATLRALPIDKALGAASVLSFCSRRTASTR